MESRRIRYTNKVIIDTFLELMKNKPINSITVTELCEIADIHRSTFYAKYATIEDLKSAAFEMIAKSLFDDAIQDIQSFSEEHIAEKITRKVLVGIKNNMDQFKKMYDYNKNIIFFNSDSLVDKYLLGRSKTIVSETKNNIIFFKNGINGIINNWIKNNCKDSVENISSYVVYILHKIFDEAWY